MLAAFKKAYLYLTIELIKGKKIKKMVDQFIIFFSLLEY